MKRKKKSAARKRREAQIRKERLAREVFLATSPIGKHINACSEGSYANDDELTNNGCIVFGLKGTDPVVSRNSTARIPVYITLRHDKGAEHWDEIICPRFPNLRNSLQDDNLFPATEAREEYGQFARTLKEVLSGDIATDIALRNLRKTEFAEWLCSGGVVTLRYRNRYSFAINVVNVFPYTVDAQGNIHLVGRCFNKGFLEGMPGDISKQFANFVKERDGVSESVVGGVAGLEQAFAAMNLPIYPVVFVKTDLEDTLGDEFFRYITFIPKLGSDSIVEVAVKRAIEINDVTVMMGNNVILHWNGKEQVSDRGTISIVGWKAPMEVRTFEEVMSSAGENISIKIIDSAGGRHEYSSGNDPFSVHIPAAQQTGIFQYEALFIDMGSTFSKMLAVGVDGETGEYEVDALGNDNKEHLKTSEFLKKFGLLSLMIDAMNDGSNVTERSESKIAELAVVFKKEMEKEPDRYALFLASAIKILARYYLEKFNKILDSVRWSFPKTRDGDFFNIVQAKVRNMIVGYTRQTGKSSFKLYPEHEALRLMFDSAIRSLAKQAHRAIQKYDENVARIGEKQSNLDAESRSKRDRYIENNKKSAIHFIHNWRIRSYANETADNEIEQHRSNAVRDKANEMSNLKSNSWYTNAYILWMLFENPHTIWGGGVFERMKHGFHGIANLFRNKGQGLHSLQSENAETTPSYGYLDAGGYSLDSVVVAKGDDIFELTRSFKAGGEQLLKKFCQCNSWDFTAEGVRKQVLLSISKGTYDNDDKFRKIASEVYGDYVEKFQKLVYCGGDRGVKAELWYLVLSGGVSVNSVFQILFNPILRRDTVGIDSADERVPDILKHEEFPAPKISSVFLYRFVEEIGCNITVSDLEVYKRIVMDQDHGRPCVTYDIVGGMLQDALSAQ